jgi:hypothetical protein
MKTYSSLAYRSVNNHKRIGLTLTFRSGHKQTQEKTWALALNLNLCGEQLLMLTSVFLIITLISYQKFIIFT